MICRALSRAGSCLGKGPATMVRAANTDYHPTRWLKSPRAVWAGAAWLRQLAALCGQTGPALPPPHCGWAAEAEAAAEYCRRNIAGHGAWPNTLILGRTSRCLAHPASFPTRELLSHMCAFGPGAGGVPVELHGERKVLNK